MAQKKIEVRKLNTQDFWSVLDILRKGGKEAFSRLREADDAESDTARGMVLFDVGMQYAQKELQQFFADISGMKLEEYQKSELDTTLEIIEQLEEKNNLGDFFQRVAGLAKKFSGGKKKATA